MNLATPPTQAHWKPTLAYPVSGYVSFMFSNSFWVGNSPNNHPQGRIQLGYFAKCFSLKSFHMWTRTWCYMDTELQVMIIEVPNLFAFLGFNFSSHISAQVEKAVYVEGMGSSLFLVGLQLRGIIPMRSCSACFPFNPKSSQRTTIITDTPCCCGEKPVQTLSRTLFCYLEPWCQVVQTNPNSKLESPFL